ncbi:hypothetical protein FBALC1_08513 [Flavobacteriales bacterium ALC-1]|nr:hypothetical protein FBALC1_08513 [Flavobacteriales bacterium ALC-1]
MRKLILTSFAIFVGFAFMNAQDIADNAIGLRIGDNDGLGTEISYQRALGDNNRLELDLGWRSGNSFTAFQLTGLYQWVWQLDGDFNWYAGVGGGVASINFDNNDIDGDTFVFAAGDIGIEYNFDFPLQLSLDFRPELGFGDYRDDLDFDIAFSVRYRF